MATKKVTKKAPVKKTAAKKTVVAKKAEPAKMAEQKVENKVCSVCGDKKSEPRYIGRFQAKDLVIALALLLSILALVMIPKGGDGYVDAKIEKWIDKNPQKVIDSLNKYVMELQQQEAESQQQKAKEVLPQVKKEIMDDKDVPYAGNAKGDVAVIEFFDYNCGHCKSASKTVSDLMKSDKNIKVLFVEMPIFGGPSTTAAKVVLVVKKIAPSKVYAVHKALMEGNARTEDGIYDAVRKAGVSVEDVKSGMEKYAKSLNDQLQRNRERAIQLGINGTPAFLIGDELIPGAIGLEDMKKAVAEARK